MAFENFRKFLNPWPAPVRIQKVRGCFHAQHLTEPIDSPENYHANDCSVSILNVALGLEHEAINAYQLGASSGLLQKPVLDLAAGLELGAINAYLGVIPAFGSKDLAKVAGRLAADETLHFTILTNAQGRPLPAGALSFGA